MPMGAEPRFQRRRDYHRPQVTIARQIQLGGTAAFVHAEAEMTLLPGEPDTGIVFEVDGIQIPARHEFLIRDPSLPHTTILGRDGRKVYTTEHVLAAVVGSGVSNLRIKTPSGHLPFFDGSSRALVEAILKAGLAQQTGHYKEVILPTTRTEIRLPSGARVRISPAEDELEVAATIDFPGTPIGRQDLYYRHSLRSFTAIAAARTFAFSPFKTEEDTRAKMPGFFVRGPKPFQANMVIWDRRDGFLTPLRQPDECVRHKVLDFLGDLALAGAEWQGRFTLYKPGHALNHSFLNEVCNGTSHG